MACSSLEADDVLLSKDTWLCPSIQGHLLKPVENDYGNRHSGGSIPSFPLTSTLLVFSLFYFLFCFIFYFILISFCSFPHLSLPMALTNISQGLQTQFSGITILMVFGIAPRMPIRHGGTKTGTTPAYKFPFKTPTAALRLSLRGVHPIFPTLRNPCPALMESHPSLQLFPEVQMLNREFNLNLSHLIQFFFLCWG